MTPTFIKTFTAAADVEGGRIVKGNATRGQALTAAAATDPLLGVADPMGAKSGGPLDVHQGGWVEVRAGGTFAAGDPLTSNASRKAIKAVPVPGSVVAIGELEGDEICAICHQAFDGKRPKYGSWLPDWPSTIRQLREAFVFEFGSAPELALQEYGHWFVLHPRSCI